MIDYYSEAFQDQFVDLMLDYPKTGFFVDIGAGTQPDNMGSNSLHFEKSGWNGIVIDADSSLIHNRNCIKYFGFVGDGTNNTVDAGNVLTSLNCPQIIDYLSIDLEGMDLIILQSILKSNYEFKVLTIEHNLYSLNPGVQELKTNIFTFLSSNGYIRFVDNVGNRANKQNLHEGYIFEDWYINPKYIKYKEALQKVKSLNENR